MTEQTTVFGRLTLLRRDGRKALFRCQCGREIERDWYDAKRGAVQSCGCLRTEQLLKRTAKPISAGERFGRLQVAAYLGRTCECVCDCGTRCVVDSTKLRTGHTQSCGCYQRDRAHTASIKVIPAGTRYGRLTVVEQDGDCCRCECECGTLVRVETKKLRNGHTQSCGCLRADNALVIAQAKVLPSGVTAFNALYAQYRAQSNVRQIEFKLTPEEFKDITSRSCHYCGAPPSQTKRSPGAVGGYTYNGIDRIDNAVGYLCENSVAACWQCNCAKGTRSMADFLAWVLLVGNPQEVLGVAAGMTAVYRTLFKRYQTTACRRGILFELSAEDFMRKVTAPCAYCGRPCHRQVTKSRPELFTGVDRVSTEQGYTMTNTLPCCWDCNNAKGQGTVEDFVLWARRVAAHSSL